MQNMLDNSPLFSTQLCSKAKSPAQHRGVNILGDTHSSISSQARTELLEERKQQESSCTPEGHRWKSLAALSERCSASPGAWANPTISLGTFSKELLLSQGAPEIAHCGSQSKWDPTGEAGQALPKENVRKR